MPGKMRSLLFPLPVCVPVSRPPLNESSLLDPFPHDEMEYIPSPPLLVVREPSFPCPLLRLHCPHRFNRLLRCSPNYSVERAFCPSLWNPVKSFFLTPLYSLFFSGCVALLSLFWPRSPPPLSPPISTVFQSPPLPSPARRYSSSD